MDVSYNLTHFSQLSYFYAPWKRQKTEGLFDVLGGIEIEHWAKMV